MIYGMRIVIEMCEKNQLEAKLKFKDSVSQILRQLSFNNAKIIENQENIAKLLNQNAILMDNFIKHELTEIEWQSK